MNDPFDTFDLEHRFDIDQTMLQKRFIEKSAAHHPDRYTDPIEQADAAAATAQVNEAYRLLADPEARANALLAHFGGPAKDEDKSLPPDLLMEMMEVREKQEEAEADDDEAKIAELRTWAAKQRRDRLDQIAAAFKLLDDQSDRDATLKSIRLHLNALRYFERMLEQLPG